MFSNHDRIAGIVLAVFATGAFYYASDTLPQRVGLYPKTVTGLMFLFSALLIGRSFLPAFRNHEFEKFFIAGRRLILGIAVTAAYFFLAGKTGFFTMTAIYIPVLSYLSGYRQLRTILLSTFVFCIVLWLTFDLAFNRPLPPEILVLWIGGKL
ncbi:MAG: tripartite tricarboxylate transporter TctB family protein [Planktomarina sp.]|nr:tripartite tricarboxylate transporter TctB family protein [Planktomarina sp.]MDE0783404.1 tripartite tricarboxylate transporter TctB family protein [Planktomarina sp.]